MTTITQRANEESSVDAWAAGDTVWMFKDPANGRWHQFNSEKHQRDTIASGKWEVAQFVRAPAPAATQEPKP